MQEQTPTKLTRNIKNQQSVIDLTEVLQDYKIIVISNREPYQHHFEDEDITWEKSSGGLVTALDPLLQTSKGTWVAWGSGSADPLMIDSKNRVKVPPDDPKYTLKRVWLTDELINGYYYGFSNKILWPLCHNAFEKPKFEDDYWIHYNHANKLFAKAIVEELDREKKNLIFINDYHLAMLPHHLKQLVGDNDAIEYYLMSFWHIPWPSWERFRILPWKEEILDSLLKMDLLGFQTENNVYNFLRTIKKEYPNYAVDFKNGKIDEIEGTNTTYAKDFQISVDFNELDQLSNYENIEDEIIQLEKEYGEQKLIFSVDRLDYSKGLLHRQRIIDRFLSNHPYYKEKVKFIQVVSPSRIRIDSYSNLRDELVKLTEEINDKHREDEWEPIELITYFVPKKRLLALYREAGIILVTSLQDGMNLVSKEGIACSKNDTAIIMSEFTGAAKTLEGAYKINPFDIQESSEVLHSVIQGDSGDINQRLKNLRQQVEKDNIYTWTVDLFRYFNQNIASIKDLQVERP